MIVTKFGGTSVEDAAAIERLRAIVQERLDQHPVVVVSAMARVTEGLLKAASLAAKGDQSSMLKLLSDLQVRPIAHGASNLSLSFVVAENDAAEAVRCLHEQLLQCRAELAFVAD